MCWLHTLSHHHMDTFSALLVLCEGKPPVTSEFPPQRPVTGCLFSLICVWTYSWANSRDTGGLRRHYAHFDITVVIYKSMVSCQKSPTRHAYAWQIGPFWQDTLEVSCSELTRMILYWNSSFKMDAKRQITQHFIIIFTDMMLWTEM